MFVCYRYIYLYILPSPLSSSLAQTDNPLPAFQRNVVPGSVFGTDGCVRLNPGLALGELLSDDDDDDLDGTITDNLRQFVQVDYSSTFHQQSFTFEAWVQIEGK